MADGRLSADELAAIEGLRRHVGDDGWPAITGRELARLLSHVRVVEAERDSMAEEIHSLYVNGISVLLKQAEARADKYRDALLGTRLHDLKGPAWPDGATGPCWCRELLPAAIFKEHSATCEELRAVLGEGAEPRTRAEEDAPHVG